MLLTVGSVLAFEFAERTNRIGLLFIGLAVIAGIYYLYGDSACILSYDGEGVQSRILDKVLDYLELLRWRGEGTLLDIGCGSGAMSIKAAKKYMKAMITGIDYWGQDGTIHKNYVRIMQKSRALPELNFGKEMRQNWTLMTIPLTPPSATLCFMRSEHSLINWH